MKECPIPERMREIEIFGVPALFTSKAIPPEAVYPGITAKFNRCAISQGMKMS